MQEVKCLWCGEWFWNFMHNWICNECLADGR